MGKDFAAAGFAKTLLGADGVVEWAEVLGCAKWIAGEDPSSPADVVHGRRLEGPSAEPLAH